MKNINFFHLFDLQSNNTCIIICKCPIFPENKDYLHCVFTVSQIIDTINYITPSVYEIIAFPYLASFKNFLSVFKT